MSHHWEIAEQLRREGHRITPQRLLVLQVVKGASGHLTAEQILDELKASYPLLNLATVYRCLQWLKETGLVTETDLGEGHRVYAYLTEHRHHHLVCLQCGKIQEIPDSILNPVREQVRQMFDFEPHIEHFALYGVCPVCRIAGVASVQE